MAHVTAVTGRHIWQRTILMQGPHKVPGIICMNCRAHRFGEDPDRPITGCISEVDVRKVGNSRLGDYREQEMRLRAQQDARERAQDQADVAPLSLHDAQRFQAHLDKLLREELG